MKRASTWVLFAVVGLTLASCSYVPLDGNAQTVNKHSVPINLLSKQPTNGKATSVERTVWFVLNGQCYATSRYVEVPAGLGAIYRVLTSGPTPDQTATGFTSALPASFRVVSAVDSNGRLLIQISQPLRRGSSEELAIAQLVLTATSNSVKRVEFAYKDRDLLLPRPGRPSIYVVTSSDYAPLVAG